MATTSGNQEVWGGRRHLGSGQAPLCGRARAAADAAAAILEAGAAILGGGRHLGAGGAARMRAQAPWRGRAKPAWAPPCWVGAGGIWGRFGGFLPTPKRLRGPGGPKKGLGAGGAPWGTL